MHQAQLICVSRKMRLLSIEPSVQNWNQGMCLCWWILLKQLRIVRKGHSFTHHLSNWIFLWRQQWLSTMHSWLFNLHCCQSLYSLLSNRFQCEVRTMLTNLRRWIVSRWWILWWQK
jgi:hypothetical protein